MLVKPNVNKDVLGKFGVPRIGGTARKAFTINILLNLYCYLESVRCLQNKSAPLLECRSFISVRFVAGNSAVAMTILSKRAAIDGGDANGELRMSASCLSVSPTGISFASCPSIQPRQSMKQDDDVGNMNETELCIIHSKQECVHMASEMVPC